MNEQRRKKIDKAIEKLTELQSILEEVRKEEDAAMRSLPKAFLSTNQGEAMCNSISSAEYALNILSDMPTLLRDIKEGKWA